MEKAVSCSVNRRQFIRGLGIGAGLFTMGKIDMAQAQEADGKVIPGLYAAGECAGGLYYEDYIGGVSLANCLVMGRIAGQQAAEILGGAKKAKAKKG